MAGSADAVDAVRRFNRFYTPLIGLLEQGYLDSPYSLTQVRVLFELAHDGPLTASDLSRRLGLDPGYVSRLLRGLAASQLIQRSRAAHDGRQSPIALTPRGREVFGDLDRRAHDGVAALVSRVSEPDRKRLVESFATVERLLAPQPAPRLIVLRPPRPGDLGWVVERHGARYADEYHWNERFEAIVAGIVARYADEHDPRRERCWIAEVDGERAGSVLCVGKDEETAQLRLLLVEPWARGQGIGRRLVQECVGFARSAGYSRIVLWTMHVLVSARRIYEAAGFRLVEEELDETFARGLNAQSWELAL